MRAEPNPVRRAGTTRSPQADRGISRPAPGPWHAHPIGGFPTVRRRFDPVSDHRVPLIGQRLCRAARQRRPILRRDAPAPTADVTHQTCLHTGREAREQADLPAEQPSSPQGARVPSAHAHPRRPRHHLRAPPQGPQEPRGLSEPGHQVPVLAADHRLRDSDAFRRTVSSGRRAGGAALVVHLLDDAPGCGRRGSAGRPGRGQGGRQRRGPQPREAPAPPSRQGSPDAPSGLLRPGDPGAAAGRGHGRARNSAPSSPVVSRGSGARTSLVTRRAPPGQGPRREVRVDRTAARLPRRDQPALRPGLPLPPELFGVRARGRDHSTGACAGPGSPYAVSGAATRGPPAATTPCRSATPTIVHRGRA